MTRKVTASAREGLPTGMVPWMGGDAAPADWDGGPVLFRNGETVPGCDTASWRHPWDGEVDGYPVMDGAESPFDIIAYTPRATPPEPSSEVVGEVVERLRDAIQADEYLDGVTLAHSDALVVIQALATRQPPPSPADDAGVRDGWIVLSGDGKRYRTWKDGWSAWTDDREEATRYARRQDAEAVHSEDEDAWSIVPFAASPKPPTVAIGAGEVEAAAISLIVDLCGAGASQSATNVRVVEDHLRQFARNLTPASASIPADVEREALDPATGRPFGDHGTGQQAIEWILHHSGDGLMEADAFLRAWEQGNLDEWPDFYAWLAARPSTGGAMDGEGGR